MINNDKVVQGSVIEDILGLTKRSIQLWAAEGKLEKLPKPEKDQYWLYTSLQKAVAHLQSEIVDAQENRDATMSAAKLQLIQEQVIYQQRRNQDILKTLVAIETLPATWTRYFVDLKPLMAALPAKAKKRLKLTAAQTKALEAEIHTLLRDIEKMPPLPGLDPEDEED